MKHYTYKTKGTCSKQIAFSLDGEIVHDVKYTFGCNGNTQGIYALAEGMEMDKLIALLDGIDCNSRGTSCPAQLAEALKEVKEGTLKEA